LQTDQVARACFQAQPWVSEDDARGGICPAAIVPTVRGSFEQVLRCEQIPTKESSQPDEHHIGSLLVGVLPVVRHPTAVPCGSFGLMGAEKYVAFFIYCGEINYYGRSPRLRAFHRDIQIQQICAFFPRWYCVKTNILRRIIHR